jgi:hypothetical protein
VRESLGRPTRTTSRRDTEGKVEIWTFVIYERVPQVETGFDSLGRWVQRVTYIKVPVGHTNVEFDNGIVVAVEEERDHSSGRRSRVRP